MESTGNNEVQKVVNTNYKFRALKVYSSENNMMDAAKKYRRVYDRYETTYMWAEFTFFNKLFDEAEWDTKVTLKCYFINGSQKNELCSLDQEKKVTKEENIVYVRQAWGNTKPGSYWFRGDYLWEAYIDGVKVGESKFFIEDQGPAQPGQNLYFDIQSIRLYEGDSKGSQAPQKKYLKGFNNVDTRFVWAEFNFKSKSAKGYLAEIFFNFYTDTGELKGVHDYSVYVSAESFDKVVTIHPGWGSDKAGLWGKDKYTLEVVFMDQLLAIVPFEVGDTAIEGDAPVLTDPESILKGVSNTATKAGPELTGESLLQESLAELNALTGLTQIKTEVNEMVQLVKFYQETGRDIMSKFSLHTVFTGNPGTGKTTVARILSRIYKGLGIVEKGHLVEVDREGLVAGFIGQTAIKTAAKVAESMGGILFIDEAYSLSVPDSSNDFGSEAIQVILKRMEDDRGKFGVIVAGYTNNMHEFISSNPGLRSRFDKYFEFPDYSPDEMFTIAMAMFRKEEVTPDEAATAHLQNYFAFVYARRDKHFGNARTVRQVVGECVKNQHLRLAAMKKEDRTPELMSIIIFNDVKEFEIREIPVVEKPRLGFRTGGN